MFTARKNNAAKMAITLIAAFSLVMPQVSTVYAATVSVTSSSSSSSEAHAESSSDGETSTSEAGASSESESSVSVEIETEENEDTLIEVEAEAEASANVEATASTENTETSAEAQSESFSSAAVSVNSNGSDHKIVICHATGSNTNPYTKVEVDKNAWDLHSSAHSDHGDDFPLGDKEECDDDNSFASAMCEASVTVKAGDTVTWTAEINGEPSDFTFEWEGTENLSGTSVSVQKEYVNAGTKTAKVTVTATDENTTSVNCSISVKVDTDDDTNGNDGDGSIRICKMIVNEDDEIQTSSSNLISGSFTVKLSETSDIDGSLVETVTFDASAFTPNESFILGGQDAECVTIDGLDETEDYFYSEESISGEYTLVGYNDQFTTQVDDLGDFFAYTVNDGSEDDNDDSDGQITLKESRAHRTLVILNSFVEEEDDNNNPDQCFAPADIMVVFDRSLSMGYDGTNPAQPLTQAKEAAKAFIDELDGSSDLVGLVSYSVDVALDYSLTTDFTAVKNKIDQLGLGSKTNIGGAIMVASNDLENNGRNNVKHVVVLLSDGNATSVGPGQNSPARGTTAIEDHPASKFALDNATAAKGEGITVYTIGLGDEHDEELLKLMASSESNYFYAPTGVELMDIYTQIAEIECEREPSDVSAHKFNDKNENGVKDTDEAGLSGWEIVLTPTGSEGVERTATTNSNGNVTFSDVIPGEYTVCEVNQNGWTQTFPADNNGCHTITVVKGQDISGLLFGNKSDDDTPPPTPKKGTLRVCKVLLNEDGDIVAGNSVDATFKINITGPNNFAKTATFTTPLVYTMDTLTENDADNDTACVEFEVEAGEYHYAAEMIDSVSSFETPKYNDQFNENVKDLLDFHLLAVDGSPEDNDNNDGVINVGEKKTRELIVLNQIKDENTGGGDDPQCSDGVDNGDADDLVDENDPGCHTDGDPDNPDSYDPNDDDETDPLPVVDLKLNGNDGTTAVDQNEEFTLSWTSDNAVVCTATNGWTGDKALNGSENDSVTSDTTYTLTCENAEGATASDSVTADIDNGNGGGGNDNPTVDIKINDTDGTVTVTSGNDFTLSWESDNAVSCVASEGWSGDKAVDGSEQTSVTSDTTFTITCENEDGDTASDSVTADINNGGGGGSGSSGGSRRSSGGQVLGATTDQCFYLRDFLRIDFDNDPVEVMKLQAFLIYFEGFTNLEVDGVFDLELENAVDAFQNRYFNDVLAPWGHEAPTGYVYLTTRKKVNEIYCQKAFPLTASQQTEVEQFRAFLNSLRSQGIDLGIGGSLFLPDTADAAGDRGDVLGAIDTDVEVNDDEVNGEDESFLTTSPRMQEIAASVLALPDTASDWGECIFWFAIALAIVYLLGTIIVNMQNTDGKTEKQIRTRKLLYFIIGSVVAVILAILLEIYCIVMPLLLVLIILAIGLIWYVNSGDKKN